jgi:hypothetical protein
MIDKTYATTEYDVDRQTFLLDAVGFRRG